LRSRSRTVPYPTPSPFAIPKAVSFTLQSHEFILTYDSARTTYLFATCAGMPNARADSLSDQITLKLGNP
jgi:hypothetical protein